MNKRLRGGGQRLFDGEQLVSERVYSLLAKGHPERFGEGTEVDLKGLPNKHWLYPVEWTLSESVMVGCALHSMFAGYQPEVFGQFG